MQKLLSQGLLTAILVVVVSGAFIGVATAHDAGDSEMPEDCEMSQGANGMMTDGHTMSMNDNCPVENWMGMMGMHSTSTDGPENCPMQ